MKVYKYFSVFAISLVSIFFTVTSSAAEIKFASVALTLSTGSEKVIETQFIVEVGKTAIFRRHKKNAAGLASTYRADFTIENTIVNELGNAIGMSSLRLFKLDTDKKQWVMEREQRMGVRLNGTAAKISMISPVSGAPQSDTVVTISPISEAEVLLKYGRTSAQNACSAETTDPIKSLKLTTKSFFDDCPTLDDCVKGPDCCSIQCDDGGWANCCGATTCHICGSSCSP